MRIRIAGVPEHYNEPWVQAIKNGSFAKIGLDVVFEPVPEGTGRLIEGLKSNQWDIAMALTEGLIKDIANGSNLRLFGTFVESPLCWAVSVGAQRSDLCGVAQLKGTRIGISRFTSGSHLMACVMAAQNGWSHQDDLTFVVNHNFKQLRDSVNELQTSEAFLWEKYMTKPFHDRNELRKIGEVMTPWPSFMMAASEEFLNENSKHIIQMLEVVQNEIRDFYVDPKTCPSLSEKFGMTEEDARNWMNAAHIVASRHISSEGLEKTLHILNSLNLAPRFDVSNLVYPKIALLDDVEEKIRHE